MIFNDANFDFILQNLIRVGIVSSINEKDATARVIFEENSISYDLPMLQHNTLKNKDYILPDVGEQVVCIFLPNSLHHGFILGSIYSSKDKPAIKNKNKRNIKFSDGTEVEYDRENHILKIDCKGKVIIQSATEVTINGNLIVNGDILVSGNIQNI
ncbi:MULTISPECIES: phage baseplate assembly protein V [Caloramator]|uniref:Phage baseplate assembly protein V n=1 Tax=Caloramator australicus RC3 TaxID=857293 RepID=I7J4Q9_9CLOT|nr:MULTISPECIES: phage baseplate assembly protein V [Caloramator]MDO6355274.1 phage baseplate assembly protein V [Caloramator sp. CAR-1]CCJ32896.1 phage baseplate assembly protein V [Caloramator australicus RC3]